MHTLKRVVIAACFAATGMLSWPQAFAQAWPHRQPIKLVAVFPPGGSVDQVARILAVPLAPATGPKLSLWKTKVALRARLAQRLWRPQRPDGYTFGVVFDTHGVNPAVLSPTCLLTASKDHLPGRADWYISPWCWPRYAGI
jgi:hypothetical protein